MPRQRVKRPGGLTTEEKANKTRDVGQELHDWANNEMKFAPQGRHADSKAPDVETFRNLCRGRGREYWEYVVTHVRSAEYVKNVKMNLTLRCVGGGDGIDENRRLADRRKLLAERDRLRAALERQRATVDKLDAEVKRSGLELSRSGIRYRELCGKVKDIRHGALLLSAFSEKCAADTDRLRDYQHQIRAYLDRYQQLMGNAGQTQYFSRLKMSVIDDSPLESSCTKDVREACEMIAKFLLKQPESQTLSSCQEEQVRNKMEHISMSYPANQIVASLVEVTNETALDVRLQTQAINIRDDVTKLRFKYETGGALMDMSVQPSLQSSVKQLLERCQLEHVLRFVAIEKHKNTTQSLSKQLAQCRQLCHVSLQQNLGGLPETLELTKLVLDWETKLVGAQAELKCAHRLANELSERRVKTEAEKTALMLKYQRIQDFTKVAEEKQRLIQALVRQTRDSQSHLHEKRAEISAYVSQSLIAHRDDVTNVANQMKGAVFNELKVFSTISLCQLTTITMESLEKILRVELTINRFRPELVPPNDALAATLEALDIPWFQAPELLLERCADLRKSLDEYETQSTSRFLPDCARTGTKLADVIGKVDRHDEAVKEKLLPKLEQCLRKTSEKLVDCIALKDLVNVWWDQPGQYCTPWVKMDGRMYEERKDEWKILCTRLRQLQRPYNV